MYELIILSVLMRGPVHGYVIAGVINDVIGPYARASNSGIYPVLAKLEATRLVSVCEEATSDGGRLSRTFEIRPAGRDRFRELMLDTSSKPREYRELFAFKVSAFDQLDPADRAAVISHYVGFSCDHVRHLQAQATDLGRHADDYGFAKAGRPYLPAVFEHLVGVWQREADWADALLRQAAVPPREKEQ